MFLIKRPNLVGIVCLISLIGSTNALSETEPDFSFSGFGQVIGGHLNTDQAKYHGYSDSFSFDQETLIGIQADYIFNDTFAASGQAVGYTSDVKQSGIEWLFLNITPSKRWQVRLGRHKTPFFNYSDSTDVGFTYPWITLPQQVYNFYLFRSFEGAFVRYDLPSKTMALNFEAYWGSFDDDYYIGEERVDVEVDGLSGLIANVSVSDFTFRASYHQGDVKVALPQIEQFAQVLALNGFVKSAQSLEIDGQLEFYQASANYETPYNFVRSEWTRVAPNFLTVPDLRAYYISAGLYQYPFTYHLTYAHSSAKFNEPISEIPIGVDPQLDALAFAYQGVFNSLDEDSLKSISVGVRWDLKPNIALKGDITFLDGDENKRSFFEISDDSFDRSATLVQFGVTWVF